jgi:glycine cleavage system H protein
MTESIVGGFAVRTDLAFDLEHHTWVDALGEGRARVGMDSLGVETSGTLAQLSFVAVGSAVERGEQIGSLEAEKFVGPIVSPVSGVVTAVNDAVAADPGSVTRDPYGKGWMVELQSGALADELADLVQGEEDIVAAFERRIHEYRMEGVLAE